jgi:hypothetical protein
MVDEADHRGAHCGDGGGERQVAEQPLQAARRFRSGMAVPGEVEVGPPGAEADHDGGQPDGEGEPVDRLTGQSGDDTADGFAEHDDGEQAEPFDERVGDKKRGRLRRAGKDRGGEPGQVDDVEEAPCRDTGTGRQEGGAHQRRGAGSRTVARS